MKHTKLELEVLVHDDVTIHDGNFVNSYKVKIKFLDLDERFEAKFGLHKSLTYSAKNGFNIRSVWDEKFGNVKSNVLTLPQLDKIGFEMNISFLSEKERYDFLKNMYVALDEWSNYWDGFSYDSNSHIELNENIWKITCNDITRRSSYSLRYQQRITNMLM